jgi:hypothetical protein
MTDKEIYKARTEGLELIAKHNKPISDTSFLEFMSCVKEISDQYKANIMFIEQEILEKCEIRKKINQVFQNESF